MSVKVREPRSRRALLAALGGGIAAFAAGAFRGLPTARAGVDGDVVLGAANAETTPTEINQQTDGVVALSISATGAGGSALVAAATETAVLAGGASRLKAAVIGENSNGGTAVQGYSGIAAPPTPPIDTGVFGTALVTGVHGSVAAANGLGVLGEGDTGVLGAGIFGVVGGVDATGIGVYGSASASAIPNVYGKTGVIGQSDLGGTAIVGFTGLSAPVPPADTGIYGRSNTGGANGRGLTGFCAAGIGLLGQTNTGVGVRAYSGTNTGVALRVSGKAAFDRSGKLTITAGHSSITKTAIPLTSASFILATLQKNVAGLAIQAAVTNPAGSSFTIYLNKAPSVSVAVAWLAVN
jgi:hypothetical protein